MRNKKNEKNDDKTLEEFAERVAAPKKVATDAGSVEQHSIAEQIAALEYLRKRSGGGAENAMKKVGFARFRRAD